MRNEDELMNYAIKQEAICRKNDSISDKLFEEYGVNRGLRDMNGKGVLTGLTNISKIVSFKNVDGVQSPCDGELWYRGYNVHSLVRKIGDNGFGFEKIAYLLLFGEMPSEDELKEFCKIMAQSRTLPTNFTRDVIMKAPTKDIMNSMTRSILTLGSYDSQLNSPEIVTNSLRQCMELISIFPMLAVYGYHAYNHYENDDSMYIHRPEPGLSTAENLLMMLRPNKHYSRLEAKVLDVALILHMEHGGGNNSTFTTRVVTSSGSDTYSTIAAAMSSLKGPKHGGANVKVMEMMANIKENIKDVHDEEEIEAYLAKILAGEVFDHKGLIYGMGHAVYSLSDPRERVFKGYVERLAVAKDREDDMLLYNTIEKLAPKLIAGERKIFKGVSPNVDFYSGFVYEMMGIPMELYTAIFAIARIVGWSAHRMEELIGTSKIIRPAYMSVMEEKE
jgi:citrate synthase